MKANNKRFKNAVAGTVALAILLTGTFAWQSFDQDALNEVLKEHGEPGGRLHDDFTGVDKNVYIENYSGGIVDGEEVEGQNVFARIRFQEYFIYGPDSDLIDENFVITSEHTVLRGDLQLQATTPDFNDKSTWDVYLFESEADENVESIRTYRDLGFSDGTPTTNYGKTNYMPTFNKNIYSLEAEVNGTYEGSDGLRHEGDRYDDYIAYSVGTELAANARYKADNMKEYPGIPEESFTENIHYKLLNETHTVQSTLGATTISMSEWRTLGSPVGEYWVYDDCLTGTETPDGWAYWAQPIEPQTATGLLLDEIITIQDPDDQWYYGVHVEAQIATAGDWGDLGDTEGATATGIYADYTEAGLSVLNRAANVLTVRNMLISKADDTAFTISDTEINTADTLKLKVDFEVINGIGDESEELIHWSVEEVGSISFATEADLENSLVATGKNVTFSPSASMVGGTFNITATSDLDPTKSVSIQVSVYSTAVVSIKNPTSAVRGAETQYTAEITTTQNQSVVWTLDGNYHANTKINPSTGVLYVSSDETSNTIRIIATSVVAGTSATQTVGVIN